MGNPILRKGKWFATAPDFRNVSLLWVAMSTLALFGLDFKVERNIPYHSPETLAQEGEYARSRCLLDLRWPIGVTNFATVVHFHGGGIVAGNRGEPAWPREARDHDPVAFVSGGYRLLTNATPTQAIGDAAAAVAWTLKNISRYGGDPKKVFVTGISGGGYLTAMVGMDRRWLAPHGFKPTDLCGIVPLTGQMTKHFNVRKVGFKDRDPQFMPKVDEWAPLFYASTNALPPSCFLTGGRDIEWKARVEENALLAASIRANGHSNCEFHETEGNHGGGVYPSRYFLRDFVMKTCNAGGIPRFVDGECTVLAGDVLPLDSSVASWLQLFWCTRYPGSNVRVAAASLDECMRGKGRTRFVPDRVFLISDALDSVAVRKVWEATEARQVLRLTATPGSIDDVLFNPAKAVSWFDGLSGGDRDLLTALLLIDAMHINPSVARVAVDAVKGVAFLPSSRHHKDSAGRKLPDCFNVTVSHIDVRDDGIAFTYAPKSLPFPAMEAYRSIERVFPVTERFNQEIFMVENLRPGTYELAFDGGEIGEFSAEEFGKGVNVALLDTPNQRKAASLVKLSETLRRKYAAWRKDRSAGNMFAMEDVREMMNAVRPDVSRVTLKLKAK